MAVALLERLGLLGGPDRRAGLAIEDLPLPRSVLVPVEPALQRAHAVATEHGRGAIGTPEALIGLLETVTQGDYPYDNPIFRLIEELEKTPQQVCEALRGVLPQALSEQRTSRTQPLLPLDARVRQALRRANELRQNSQTDRVSPLHLLIGLLEQDGLHSTAFGHIGLESRGLLIAAHFQLIKARLANTNPL